ncbi:MAG: alpha/beta fold hydrolase [Solirubrobacteraceae bacterium]|nr:alpha/beta fold hydrolase [Solirubrobacteraceae bacterium]
MAGELQQRKIAGVFDAMDADGNGLLEELMLLVDELGSMGEEVRATADAMFDTIDGSGRTSGAATISSRPRSGCSVRTRAAERASGGQNCIVEGVGWSGSWRSRHGLRPPVWATCPLAGAELDPCDIASSARRPDRRRYGATVQVLRTNGLEIAYERVGAGPPLVFVHGAAEDGRIWRPQLAALSDEFTVVAWDEPGAGRSSDVPPDFELAGYANCLAALVEELGLGPAHVAGLSWGGTLAQELYRRRPELVATLTLADTYAGWKGSLPPEEVRARVAGARQMLAAPPDRFVPTLPGLFAGEPPAQYAALLDQIAAGVRPQSLRTQLLVMAETDQRDLLARIAVPTLLIWGELDERSPLGVARQFERAIPGAKLVVLPGCGHVSNLEGPEQFNAAVRDFCRAHPPR